MAAKAKLIVDITKESDAEALVKTDKVLKNLEEHSNIYINPTIPLVTMKGDRDNYENKLIAAQHGGKEATSAKKLARKLVNRNYSANGNYSNSVANGNKEKALLSGYELAKEHKAAVKAGFELGNGGTTGDVDVYCRFKPKMLIIKLIQCTYTPENESSWELCAATKKLKVTLRKKDVLKTLWVRYALVMNETVFEFSEPLSIFVL